MYKRQGICDYLGIEYKLESEDKLMSKEYEELKAENDRQMCIRDRRYYVRRLERNKDYYLLEWEDLAKFKRNNPSIDKMISSLCVINRQGACLLYTSRETYI